MTYYTVVRIKTQRRRNADRLSEEVFDKLAGLRGGCAEDVTVFNPNTKGAVECAALIERVWPVVLK